MTVWLAATSYTLFGIENHIVGTFQTRIEQQEEFNTLLDHLEESIIILSEKNIDFINDKCLELLDPIISKFDVDFNNSANQSSSSQN